MKLEIALQPKQKAFLQAVESTPITFYGGARGGGKSKGLQLIMLLRRFKYPESNGAIFRRTYPELEGNHIRPLFQSYPELREYWNESKKLLSLPNGSTLQFCHCNNEADIDLYQGREINDLAIDEAGQWTETMFRRLLASNRSAKAGILARAILTGNPGGVGHGWLKRLFIERRFNDRERSSDYVFIQALVDDNAALVANDPAYVARLEAEPNEAIRKAWRFGDWDIFAGQYFTELQRDKHLVDPFEIPAHWNRFGAYDFGFNHPAAFLWFAVDEDGNVYLYREFVKSQMRVDQFCKEIKAFSDTEKLFTIPAGWDCWAKKSVISSGTPPTIAEEFLNHGIILAKAQIDRVQGASQLRRYLAWRGTETETPRLFIFKNCSVTWNAITRMEYDPDHPEDTLKIDATDGDPMSGDDAYDALRYGLMSRPQLTDRPKIRIRPGTPQMISHNKKLLDEQLQKEIDRQQADENERKQFETFGMESNEIAKYYIQEKRHR
jgi:phage terminase large subunit